jgi:S1-C subfamily serine protease
MYTQQKIQNSSSLLPGMTKEKVQEIMGMPVKTEFAGDLSAWHYCRTGYGSDEFVVVIFSGDFVREARNYTVTLAETGGATGDCSKFVRSVDFGSSPLTEPNDENHEVRKIGTAWLLDSGYVITCQHVIAEANSYLLIDRNKQETALELIAQDRSNDIALLRAKELSSRSGIPISTDKTNTGAKVFTIGYPHPELLGSSPKLSVGIVNSQIGFLDDPRTYQISVPLQSGNSGGPLIDEYGYAVGIVTSKLNAIKMFMWTGDLPENVNYAVKTSYLCLLLNDYTNLECTQKVEKSKKSIEELTKQLESKIYQIVSEKK